MEVISLKALYSKVSQHIDRVFVVPLIRFNFPKTDYLYQLYKEMLNDNTAPKIISTSIFNHYKFVLSAILHKNTLLHYHWLEFQDGKSLLGMPYKILCIALFKLFGGKLIWTVHNKSPHDKKFLDLHVALHKWMAKRADIIHVHSETARSIISDFLDVTKEKIVVLAHPVFPAEIMPKEIAQKQFLKIYGNGRSTLLDPVFLIFGGISSYKGIEEIVTILCSKEEPFTLIIAGYLKKGQDSVHKFISSKTSTDFRVLYKPIFIPEEHYPMLLNSVDICVFNYDDILTSGGVAMAQSYKKTIIATNKGGLKELHQHKNVHLFDSTKELKNHLDSAFKEINRA